MSWGRMGRRLGLAALNTVNMGLCIAVLGLRNEDENQELVKGLAIANIVTQLGVLLSNLTTALIDPIANNVAFPRRYVVGCLETIRPCLTIGQVERLVAEDYTTFAGLGIANGVFGISSVAAAESSRTAMENSMGNGEGGPIFSAKQMKSAVKPAISKAANNPELDFSYHRLTSVV